MLYILRLLHHQLHSLMLEGTLLSCHSCIFEAGRGICQYVHDWFIAQAVINYAVNCWHIPRIDLVPAVLDNFGADFQDGHRCFTRTAARQNYPPSPLLSHDLYCHMTFPVANLQSGPRRSKTKQCWKFGHKDTYVRFLYCDIGEYVTKCKVDNAGRIALNSFTSALLKAESLPSSSFDSYQTFVLVYSNCIVLVVVRSVFCKREAWCVTPH